LIADRGHFNDLSLQQLNAIIVGQNSNLSHSMKLFDRESVCGNLKGHILQKYSDFSRLEQSAAVEIRQQALHAD
jgi:hypothetical protein